MPEVKIPARDAAEDLLRTPGRPLDPMFTPRSVAVVGATEKVGTVGCTLLRNLIATPFGGTVYPVNPKRPSVQGIRAYPSVKSIPEPVDLAVVITPASAVPAVITDCVEAGVKGVIVISAGFKETGPAGEELERQTVAAAKGKFRIVGPNCLGVMNPISGFNATFADGIALPGSVAFISQSGALCTAILDWSKKAQVGFSAFFSTGAMADVSWGDYIYHLGDDPQTKAIVIYMESVGNARAFLSAAREIAMSKPIIIIKAGRTEAAAKAAASHTGALAGSNDVLDAAFRRCGVLRVNQISELFSLADVLAKQPRPRGPRLAIITNAGGPGVLATDALATAGGELAQLKPETMERLNAILPPAWSHGNPIDVLGDADPEKYVKAVEIVARDPNCDGMLVIVTPQAMTNAAAIAERMQAVAKIADKPILASWMGGDAVERGIEILNRAGIPTFAYPDTAAETFQYMWQFSANLARLYETPAVTTAEDVDAAARTRVDNAIKAAQQAGRTLMTEAESKQLLSSYGIPTVPTHISDSEADAVNKADLVGYPVVLKLYSHTITHKTDVGGVQLNLQSPDDVRRAYRAIEKAVTEKKGAQHFNGVTVQPMIRMKGYEIILGSSVDPQFGPVLLFGLGGQLVEVFKDRALALPPLTTVLARQLMERTRIFTALKGVRGQKQVDLAALDRLLVRFSQLIVEQPRIKEIDINPLLASPDGILALDARVLLHDWQIPDDKLPHAAIRPYPVQYMGPWKMKDGTAVTIRPIRPEDELLMIKFHETLSEQTVRLRYQETLKLDQRITHARLTRICFTDYDRELALVVERKDSNGARQIIAVGRLSKQHGANEGRVYLVISDQFQRQGLGHELLKRLVDAARAEKLNRLTAEMLPEASIMLHLCESHGFKITPSKGEEPVRAELVL